MVETDVFDSYLRCYSSTGGGAASLVLVWCPTTNLVFTVLDSEAHVTSAKRGINPINAWLQDLHFTYMLFSYSAISNLFCKSLL
jgi:hypothetical protein